MQKILQFKGKWRAYQERVLKELSFHILDKKLNIVAAPGAGKTTLGIEVIARLNTPALILAPTLTIRNQWVERMASAFLTVPAKEVISTDIRTPKQITVITYQALLAAFCKACEKEETDTLENEEDTREKEKNLFARFNKEEADKIILKLKEAKVDLLCFDEAHHLRNEWWKALDYLTENLQVSHTLSLTATPPYDVNYSEWKRYEALCGPIDSLISIPELVKNGDLCPHQDFIHFSKLRDHENKDVDDFDKKVSQFISILKDDKELALKIAQTKYFTAPQANITDILDDADFYISLSSFLKFAGVEIPKDFLNIFDVSLYLIPSFSPSWIEKFLSGLFIYRKKFPEMEGEIASLEKTAKSAGILIRSKVSFNNNPSVARMVACSLGKIDSITEIVKSEKEALSKALRMVILADYIRLDSLGKAVKSLGVVPIFETLRNVRGLNLNIAVLTGGIVLIPVSIKDNFLALLKERNLDQKTVTLKELESDKNYLRIMPSDATRAVIVALMTKLFGQGHINILIGTQALLGEGWDAPSINSLILSSTVSSYMLSNQMRGRAIRIDKANPAKVANIWHLASVREMNFTDELKGMLPSTVTQEEARALNFNYTYDLAKVSRRFKCFEGPAYKAPHKIQSGINRVDLKNDIQREKQVLPANKRALALSKDRAKTRQIWQDALEDAYNIGDLRQGLEVKEPKAKKDTLIFSGTIKYVLFFHLLTLAGVGITLQEALGPKAFLAGLAVYLLLIFKPLVKYIRTGSLEGTLKQVTRCVLEAFYSMDIVKSNIKTVGIHIEETAKGQYFFNVSNVSYEENNQILKAVREILDPIESPRYIIERHGSVFEFFKTKDYHSVPDIIGKNKKNAEVFEMLWKKYVSPCRMVFTRTQEGRMLMLKARKKAFSNQFRKGSLKNLSKWG